jgi:tRNA(fMet)-specific endonuclease VapC
VSWGLGPRHRAAVVAPNHEVAGPVRVSAVYMLDTDAVSFALRGYGHVGVRIVDHAPSEQSVSAITVAELRFGADRRKSVKLHRLIDTFTDTISVAPFDEACAATFGKLASKLVAKGRPIGNYDSLIAAHAIALGVILVTNNEKHFDQVDGLKIENWV